MPITFNAVPTSIVDNLRNGGTDSYGLAPETAVSDGNGNPCRHCLKMIPEGAPYLIAAYKPFEALNPYTETGPIFLCAEPCKRTPESVALPGILDSPAYIIRGYDNAERIVYGTGQITATEDIPDAASRLFHDPNITFIHVRSASNNCFHVRIDSAEDLP